MPLRHPLVREETFCWSLHPSRHKKGEATLHFHMAKGRNHIPGDNPFILGNEP